MSSTLRGDGGGPASARERARVLALLARHLLGDLPVGGIDERGGQPLVLLLGDVLFLLEPVEDDRLIAELLQPVQRLADRGGVRRAPGDRLDARAPPRGVPLLGFRQPAQDVAPVRIGLALAEQAVGGRGFDLLAPELLK